MNSCKHDPGLGLTFCQECNPEEVGNLPSRFSMENPPKREVREEIWTTNDGRQIPVGEMEVEHLRATLRMILRGQRVALEHEALRWVERRTREARMGEENPEIYDALNEHRRWGSS